MTYSKFNLYMLGYLSNGMFEREAKSHVLERGRDGIKRMVERVAERDVSERGGKEGERMIEGMAES